MSIFVISCACAYYFCLCYSQFVCVSMFLCVKQEGVKGNEYYANSTTKFYLFPKSKSIKRRGRKKVKKISQIFTDISYAPNIITLCYVWKGGDEIDRQRIRQKYRYLFFVDIKMDRKIDAKQKRNLARMQTKQYQQEEDDLSRCLSIILANACIKRPKQQ